MSQISRRVMIASCVAGLSTLTRTPSFGSESEGNAKRRKFTMDLSWGPIGVRASQIEAIGYAAKYGFESVHADPGYLSSLDDSARGELASMMQAKRIVWGAAGLPVEFRKDEQTYQTDLKKLPAAARAMQLAGVTRVGTWLRPYHEELTYVANFRQHARRLKACVRILGDQGQRFGMEYVGPKTLWASTNHSFIHTMAETKELITEIGESNVGFVLDSWHWYTAHETAADLRSLTNKDIVACDLNDAPPGLEIDHQIDNKRELPAATGVIDLKTFLGVLVEIGYDGPIRAEPFNAKLNALDNDDACRSTSDAMKRAFAMVSK